MGTKILYLINLMRDLAVIMERKQVLQDFKLLASLDPDCTREDVAIHLLNQWMEVEMVKNKLVMKVIKKQPERLNIVFGEVAQSFEKSIFANSPEVNVKNSFLNSNHMRLLEPGHQKHDSIPDRLCDEFNTLVIDIYVIPIHTEILSVIRTEMRKTGLTQRLLDVQSEILDDLLAVTQPQNVCFICRYKSLLQDSSYLVDKLVRNCHSSTIEFIREFALSGYRGMMDDQKWRDFILTT
jgi:hypothetical protein